MYFSDRIRRRLHASWVDCTVGTLFALLALSLAVPASAQYGGGRVDLELAKSVAPDAAAGGEVEFTITVSSQRYYGAATATNIVVKDYLPHGLTAVSAKITVLTTPSGR